MALWLEVAILHKKRAFFALQSSTSGIRREAAPMDREHGSGHAPAGETREPS